MKHHQPEAPAAANAPPAPGDERAPVEATATAGDSVAGEPGEPGDTMEAELARAVDARLRAEAELVNARRRALKEIEDAERRGAERTLAPVLAVADDLDRALEAAAQAGEAAGALAQGVGLVLARLVDKLANEGVTPIVPVGELFDPRWHEALTQAAHPTIPAGHVSQVIARGWRHGERLLRPAGVLVSSGPPAGSEAD